LSTPNVSGTLAPNPPRPRLDVLDAARVLATLGVIWTHVVEVQDHPPRIAALGRFGTSYYILAAVLFAYRSQGTERKVTWKRELAVRFRRLLVPYFLWSLIYGILYYRYGVSVGMNFREIAAWWGPLAGTARHLWFLPFAFFAATLASVCSGYLRRLETPVLATWVGLGVPFVYWALEAHVFFWLDRPWAVGAHLHRVDRWIEELPLALSAILVIPLVERLSAGAKLEGPISGRQLAVLPLFGAVLVEWAYYKLAEPLHPISGGETREFAHAVGACLMAAFFMMRDLPVMRPLGRLGRHTYFIFLGHVIVLDAVNALVHDTPAFGTLALSAAIVLGLFALGLVLGPIVLKIPVLRWLYPR
jgi:fucose 4-O-acetylase-like acetyltransferase